jgi:hypothetical protein
MGLNCQNIFIEGYTANLSTPVGNVPYSVYNCSSTTPTATLILSNTSDRGFTYNALYLYFGSRSNMTGFNSYVNWIVTTSRHNFSIGLSTPPYLIELNSPLNRNSKLIFGGIGGNYYKLNTTPNDKYELFAYDYYNQKDVTDNVSTEILIADSSALYTRYLSTYDCIYPSNPLCSISGKTVVNTSTYWITGGGSATGSLTANITNNTVTITHLYTQNYNVGAYTHYTGSCGLPNANNASVAYPLGNASSYPKLSGNFYYNVAHINATLTAQHLNGQVSFLGYFKMPEYAVVIITLIGTLITIGISLDEKPLMLVFIAFWILGIYNIGFGVLALVLTLAYGAYRFTHHHK